MSFRPSREPSRKERWVSEIGTDEAVAEERGGEWETGRGGEAGKGEVHV
jgi:hypothetical protein